MGKDTTAQARLETLVRVASSGADTVKGHAGQAAEQVRHAAEPAWNAARSATQQLAEQTRHTAGTLTARAHHDTHRPRLRPGRWAVAAACALGIGALLWGLARSPHPVEEPAVLPVQPVPPA